MHTCSSVLSCFIKESKNSDEHMEGKNILDNI